MSSTAAGQSEPSSARIGLDTAGLARLVDAVRSCEPARDDAERIDRIRLFEELKSAAAAAQLVEAAAFAASQTGSHSVVRASGADRTRAHRPGRGIAAQVALARRISPYQARRWLGWARILTAELPACFAQLRAGRTSEWRVVSVAAETVLLSAEDRAAVDADLGPRLERLGDRQVQAAARAAAYRVDPQTFVDRRRVAERGRRVSVRPRPDVMASLTGTLPMAQAIAAWAALRAAADGVVAVGDPAGRTRDQVMADLLVQRLTGQAVADDVPLEIELVVPADTLLADGCEPATLGADGLTPVPLPAPTARDLVTRRSSAAPTWLRRLYRRPESGQLVAMDSRRRCFTPAQRRFVRYRDQYCATPWCGAPIRHIDHVVPAAEGGATSIANAQGLCVACNHAKQAPGWTSRGEPDGSTTTTTPTDHNYRGVRPRAPGAAANDTSTGAVVLVHLTRWTLPPFRYAA